MRTHQRMTMPSEIWENLVAVAMIVAMAALLAAAAYATGNIGAITSAPNPLRRIASRPVSSSLLIKQELEATAGHPAAKQGLGAAP